ncbi:hypothetical protein KM043_011527 [Ampulex compressa]|nr:hypothetical protein KM043_011527 [Ampulex compressa]
MPMDERRWPLSCIHPMRRETTKADGPIPGAYIGGRARSRKGEGSGEGGGGIKQARFQGDRCIHRFDHYTGFGPTRLEQRSLFPRDLAAGFPDSLPFSILATMPGPRGVCLSAGKGRRATVNI